MVEGYAGHLFSHGIDYEARDKELKAMMMGARRMARHRREPQCPVSLLGSNGNKRLTPTQPSHGKISP